MVSHQDMPGFLLLAHVMKNALPLRNVEVKVGFHSPVVYMWGHGVPNAARLQNGKAHYQLAALDAIRMDVFINGTMIGCFGIACHHFHSVSYRH